MRGLLLATTGVVVVSGAVAVVALHPARLEPPAQGPTNPGLERTASVETALEAILEVPRCESARLAPTSPPPRDVASVPVTARAQALAAIPSAARVPAVAPPAARGPAAREATPTAPAQPHVGQPVRPVLELATTLPPPPDAIPALEKAEAAPGLRLPMQVDVETSVRDTLERSVVAFESCYARSLRHDESIRGRVLVEVSVRADGAVEKAQVVQSTVHDDEVLGCIAGRVRQLHFTPVGEDIEVQVPLALVVHED